MADDPNPALRAELDAALGALTPQLRGLHDLTAVSLSSDAKAAINDQIIERQRRHDLIQSVLDKLDAVLTALIALDADGYPDLPSTTVPRSLFSELQEEVSDVGAAAAVFEAELPVTHVAVNLGPPVSKSKSDK